MGQIILMIFAVVLGAVLSKLAELLVDGLKRSRSERLAIRLAGPDDVSQWGWDGKTLLKKLIELDRKLLGSSLTNEREGTVDQWAPIFMGYPETWALLVRGPKNIVGYWHFAALREETYNRAYSGELLDSEIVPETMEALETPGRHHLYFIMIGVLPEYPSGLNTLMEAFFDRLETLAQRGIFFSEVCANAFTSKGVRLCQGFGMTAKKEHRDFGRIYGVPLFPWPEHLKYRRWDALAALYKAEYTTHLLRGETHLW
jgi:hypothetical protein